MAAITVDTVAEYFTLIWPTFCPDSVTVELHEHSMKSPFLGLIAYDGQGWRILAPSNAKSPKALLEILYHEADHVRRGQVARDRYDFTVARAMMQGKTVVRQAAAPVREFCRESRATPAARQQEDDATLWALVQAAESWKILEEWRDPQEAARVVWWVYRELSKEG